MKLAIVAVILLLLAVVLRLAIPRLGSSVAGGTIERDGRSVLAPCPATPNCHQAEWPIQGEPSQVIDTVVSLVATQSGSALITRTDNYLHATFSTPLMGFMDDVEFLISVRETDAQPVLLVRSASRLGHSDLGANAQRIETLRTTIGATL